jgi:hypothetical protein
MIPREPPVPPEVLRNIDPGQKLAVAQALREMAWQLSAAGIQARNPGLPESEVQDRVRELFARARA